MKTQRFYKLVILALVLLNVSIMVFFWVNRPPKPPRPGAHQIATMLGLKGEEKRKVDLLEKEHHKEKRKLVHKDMDLHDQLFSSFGDKDKSDSLLMVIDKNKSKIEEMTFEYFNEIASYCDKGQSEILHSFLKDSFEKMRGPAPFGR